MPSWREREAARRVAAEDAERRKKTEVTAANFPTLSSAQPSQREAVAGSVFAQLADKWAKDEDSERRVAEYRKSREESERRQYDAFYRVSSSRRTYDRYDEEEYEEEAPAPAPSPAAAGAVEDEDSGWIEVKRKVRKPKRELSIAEMEARDRQRDAEEENQEFNAHLYESGRHDHDRV